MKQKIFKILKWFLGISLLMFLVLTLLTQIYQDKVGELVVKELNKTLKKEITVESVDLSLVRYFPKAAVELTNVNVPDAQNGILLNAQTMALEFNIFSLFSDKIKVQTLDIYSGSLNVLTDKNGNYNYDIFIASEQESNDSKKANDLKLGIEQANFDDIHLIYENKQLKQSGIVHLESLNLSGEFSSNNFDLVSNAEIEIEFFTTKDGELLSGRHLAYEAQVKVDLKKGEYQIDKTNLYIESNKFTVDGTIISKTDFTDFDLSLNGIDGSLQSVISLLPKQQITLLEDFDSRGNFFIKSNVKGRLSQRETPAIDLHFGLKDGYISSKSLDNELNNVSFEVQFENETKSSSGKAFVEMIEFSGELLDEQLIANLFIEDFNNPLIDFRFDGKIPMEATFGLLGDKVFSNGDGAIKLKNIIIEGRYKDMISLYRIPNVNANGLIEFEDMDLDIGEEKMSISSGEIYINNNDLDINNVNLELPDNTMRFKGTFRNLLPVLLRDSINTNNAKLEFNTALTAEKIDINRLLSFIETFQNSGTEVDKKPKEEIADKPIDKSEELTEKGNVTESPYYDFLKLFDGNFDVDVQRFSYDDIEAQNASGKMTIENGRLLLQNIEIDDFTYDKIIGKDFTGNLAFQGKLAILKDVALDVFGGEVALDGNVFLESENSYMDGFVVCNNLNGNTLFKQMDNFDQEVILAENIAGRLDAKVKLKTFWDKDGNILYDKLYALADVTINNGELIEFEMLQGFSSFVKLKDLKRIKFTKTQNQLEIKNGRLTLPAMLIQNNAVNLNIAGWHDFDLDFEYFIKVNAGQTLAEKFKRFNPSRKAKKSKNGWLNIYVRVFGDANDYNYEYDKDGVKNALKLNQQFQQIQNDIQMEFNESALIEPEAWENDEN